MARARIHPGTRKKLAAAAGFFVLAAAGAAAGAGLLSQSNVCPDPTKYILDKDVLLELDYLSGTNAIKSRTDPNCTMENALAPLGVRLTVSDSPESFTPRDPDDCMYPDEADSLVCGTLDWDSSWSAHGVVVPNQAVFELDSNGDWNCPGGRLGIVWLLPPCGSATSSTSRWISGNRKNFLAFWQKDGGTARDNQAFITNVHELGHVLNLHHCEFDQDHLDDYGFFTGGGYCTNHWKERGKNEKHVMPGTTADAGLSFCDYNRTHWKMHKNQSCCDTNRVEPEAGAEAEDLETLGNSVDLILAAEKDRYFPGEPIHVKVSLKPKKGAEISQYEVFPQSLKPDLGYLFFSVKSKGWFSNYRTLGPPLLHEPKKRNAAPLSGRGLEQEAVGIWFTLSDSDNPPYRTPFWLKADYAGFSNRALHLASVPIEIEVNTTNTTPGLYDSDAYELFMLPAARQFLYLLGGDHLRPGFNALMTISSEFSQTIYSPYADIALGAYWSRPFKGLDANGRTIDRAPNVAKARHHLLKAKAWNDGHQSDELAKLPPSWKAILDQTLARVKQAINPSHV